MVRRRTTCTLDALYFGLQSFFVNVNSILTVHHSLFSKFTLNSHGIYLDDRSEPETNQIFLICTLITT